MMLNSRKEKHGLTWRAITDKDRGLGLEFYSESTVPKVKLQTDRDYSSNYPYLEDKLEGGLSD